MVGSSIDSILKFFGDLVRVVRLTDVIDILIVALLIYQILVLIKGTRSVQILASLGALFAVFVFSDFFQMRTVRAILGNMFDNLFIVFILLFQNDIRRVFTQVGRSPFFARANALHDSQLVEEVIKSCVSLSNKKIGALIVLERQADVLDFVEPGTIVDSQCTKELITSIFLPVSPLHDGAVVIRKGRIYMAGCFLPLTLNPLTSKSMGTRHRAAVGLTEETDAMCIVVSEENGQISLAMGGRINHQLDASQLRRAILESAGS